MPNPKPVNLQLAFLSQHLFPDDPVSSDSALSHYETNTISKWLLEGAQKDWVFCFALLQPIIQKST